MSDQPDDITRLLHLWRNGDRDAESKLFTLVMPDLRRLAHYFMRRERPGHSWQATELVNQIYFRLVAAKNQDWRNRRHFFALSARAMRQFLIDRGRSRPDLVPLDGFENHLRADSVKLNLTITLDRLLDELAKINPEWAQVVEVKYFLCLTDEEAAEALGMKLRTMQRMWRDARQWLYERLDPPNGKSPNGK